MRSAVGARSGGQVHQFVADQADAAAPHRRVEVVGSSDSAARLQWLCHICKSQATQLERARISPNFARTETGYGGLGFWRETYYTWVGRWECRCRPRGYPRRESWRWGISLAVQSRSPRDTGCVRWWSRWARWDSRKYRKTHWGSGTEWAWPECIPEAADSPPEWFQQREMSLTRWWAARMIALSPVSATPTETG